MIRGLGVQHHFLDEEIGAQRVGQCHSYVTLLGDEEQRCLRSQLRRRFCVAGLTCPGECKTGRPWQAGCLLPHFQRQLEMEQSSNVMSISLCPPPSPWGEWAGTRAWSEHLLPFMSSWTWSASCISDAEKMGSAGQQGCALASSPEGVLGSDDAWTG